MLKEKIDKILKKARLKMVIKVLLLFLYLLLASTVIGMLNAYNFRNGQINLAICGLIVGSAFWVYFLEQNIFRDKESAKIDKRYKEINAIYKEKNNKYEKMYNYLYKIYIGTNPDCRDAKERADDRIFIRSLRCRYETDKCSMLILGTIVTVFIALSEQIEKIVLLVVYFILGAFKEMSILEEAREIEFTKILPILSIVWLVWIVLSSVKLFSAKVYVNKVLNDIEQDEQHVMKLLGKKICEEKSEDDSNEE